MHPALIIVTWVVLDPPRHKVGQAQLQSIVKWKSSVQDQVPVGPESMSKLHEQEVQANLSSTTLAPAYTHDHIKGGDRVTTS